MIRSSFNDGWFFADYKECRDIFDNAPEFIPVQLPHDATIHTKRLGDSKNQNSTGFFDGSVYVYKKTLFAPEDYAGKTVLLEFEGVYLNACIYVNDQPAGKCTFGYISFFIDIGKYLKFGQDNEIKVIAKTGMEMTSRWYSGGGIYRKVNLLIGGPIHIPANGIRVDTKKIDTDGIIIEVTTSIESYDPCRRSLKLLTEIQDVDGCTLASDCTPLTIWRGEKTNVNRRLFCADILPWSIDNPNLYQVKCILMDGDREIDLASAKFGARVIDMDTRHGLRLNGNSIKLKGGCIHHDNGPLGAATFAKAEDRRIKLMKAAGFNAIRSAHNPASKELLDACDRYGMLVIEETFDMWNTSKSDHDYSLHFQENWHSDLQVVVDRDYNHPCVFMYMIGNEIQEIGTVQGAEQNRKMAEYMRQLDATRDVGNAINGMFTVMSEMDKILPEILDGKDDLAKPTGDVNDFMTILDSNMPEIMRHEIVGRAIEEACGGLDICGYNYMDSRYEMDGRIYPNRIIVGSETNSNKIGYSWPLIMRLPYVLGDFVWTGWDYLGESGIGRVDYTQKKTKGIYGPYPWYIAYCGDYDICGNRRPQSYYREIVWGLRKDPFIAVGRPQYYGQDTVMTNWSWSDSIASWTWPGFEEKPVAIEVYSDGDEVEIFLNDVSLGKKCVGVRMPNAADFETTYQPGTITAVSYREGRETGRISLTTANRAVGITALPDKSEMTAGGQDLIFLSISLTDENGGIDTSFGGEVRIEVEGAGVLQGYGSANPKSTQNFFDTVWRPMDGRLLAVIRSGMEPGEIRVRLCGDGLSAAELSFNVI